MNRESARIWYDEDRFYGDKEGLGYVISEEDVEEVVDLRFEVLYMFPELEPTQENKLMLEGHLDKFAEFDCVSQFEELLGTKVVLSATFEKPEDVLVYWGCEGIYSLLYFETCHIYNYHDGNNWVNKVLDEHMSEDLVEYDKGDCYILDTWDGNNYSYGDKFSHGKIYRVLKVDGQDVEDTYLLYLWDQFQGTLPTGRLIDGKEKDSLIADAGKEDKHGAY